MFLEDEHMDASEVISMVAETAHNLAALASDETVTHEAPDRCMKAAHDLETSVALILTAPWIPRDAPTLTASLQAVNKNLKSVQNEIDSKIHDVLDHGPPEGILRMGAAYCGARLLEHQREILRTTRTSLLTWPCGYGTFRAQGWAN